MSQPAVSEALRQLRRSFNDELLTPEGRQYVPTTLGKRLQGQLEAALELVEHFVLGSDFDPASVVATVKIATNDYVILAWGAMVAARIANLAPKITLEFEAIAVDTTEKVLAGLVDFATLPSDAREIGNDRFDTVRLFDDELICIVPASSPIVGEISREQLSNMPQVAYLPSGSVHHSQIRDLLRHEGLPFKPRAFVPAFSLLPHMVSITGAVALTYRRLGLFATGGGAVRVVETPFTSWKSEVLAISRRDANRDQLKEWLREQFAAVAADITPSRCLPLR